VTSRHHRRRGAAHARHPAAWVREIRALRADAGGVMTLQVVRPETMSPLGLAARRRDPVALATLGVLSRWDASIQGAPEPPLCLCCEFSFSGRAVPGAFMVTLPARDDPALGLVSPICRGCAAGTDAEIFKTGVARLRASLWPDLRPLSSAYMPATAGTA
jgi:hypothetical protein